MSHDVHATNDSQVEVSNGGRQNHSLLHHQGKFRCSSGRSVSEAALRFGNLCVHLSTLQKKPYASSEETFWFLEEAFQFAVRHYFWRVLYLQLASFPAVCRLLAYSSHQLMHMLCVISHTAVVVTVKAAMVAMGTQKHSWPQHNYQTKRQPHRTQVRWSSCDALLMPHPFLHPVSIFTLNPSICTSMSLTLAAMRSWCPIPPCIPSTHRLSPLATVWNFWVCIQKARHEKSYWYWNDM